jgi:hypothetical protein
MPDGTSDPTDKNEFSMPEKPTWKNSETYPTTANPGASNLASTQSKKIPLKKIFAIRNPRIVL